MPGMILGDHADPSSSLGGENGRVKHRFTSKTRISDYKKIKAFLSKKKAWVNGMAKQATALIAASKAPHILRPLDRHIQLLATKVNAYKRRVDERIMAVRAASVSNASIDSRHEIGPGGIGDTGRYSWEEYLGKQTRAYHPYNPTDQQPRTVWDLPEALDGLAYFIEQVIDQELITNETWYTTVIFTTVFIQEMVVKWTEWVYGQHFLDDEPEQTIGRLISDKRTDHSDAIKSKGLSFKMEHGYMLTAQGRDNYRRKIEQLISADQEDANFQVIYALLHAHDRVLDYNVENGYYDMSDLMQRLAREPKEWAVIQKRKHGLVKVFEKLIEDQRQRRGTGDSLIMPRDVSVYLQLVPPENTDYYLAGKRGPDRVNSPNIDDGVQPRGTFMGHNVYITRSFNVKKSGPVHLMKRNHQIGDYAILSNANKSKKFSKYTTSDVNALIYDENADENIEVEFGHAYAMAGIYDKAGKLKLPTKRHDVRFYDYDIKTDFLSVPGRFGDKKSGRVPLPVWGMQLQEHMPVGDYLDAGTTMLNSVNKMYAGGYAEVNSIFLDGITLLKTIEDSPYIHSWFEAVRDATKAKNGGVPTRSTPLGRSAYTLPTQELYADPASGGVVLPNTTANGGIGSSSPAGTQGWTNLVALSNQFRNNMKVDGANGSSVNTNGFDISMLKKADAYVTLIERMADSWKNIGDSFFVDPRNTEPWLAKASSAAALHQNLVLPRRVPWFIKLAGGDEQADVSTPTDIQTAAAQPVGNWDAADKLKDLGIKQEIDAFRDAFVRGFPEVGLDRQNIFDRAFGHTEGGETADYGDWGIGVSPLNESEVRDRLYAAFPGAFPPSGLSNNQALAARQNLLQVFRQIRPRTVKTGADSRERKNKSKGVDALLIDLQNGHVSSNPVVGSVESLEGLNAAAATVTRPLTTAVLAELVMKNHKLYGGESRARAIAEKLIENFQHAVQKDAEVAASGRGGTFGTRQAVVIQPAEVVTAAGQDEYVRTSMLVSPVTFMNWYELNATKEGSPIVYPGSLVDPTRPASDTEMAQWYNAMQNSRFDSMEANQIQATLPPHLRSIGTMVGADLDAMPIMAGARQSKKACQFTTAEESSIRNHWYQEPANALLVPAPRVSMRSAMHQQSYGSVDPRTGRYSAGDAPSQFVNSSASDNISDSLARACVCGTFALNMHDVAKNAISVLQRVASHTYLGYSTDKIVLDRMMKADILPPLNVMVARPHMRYMTAMIIRCLSNGGTGYFFRMKSMFEIGDSAETMMHLAHYRRYAKAVVYNWRNVAILPAVMSVEVLGGAGLRPYDAREYSPENNRYGVGSAFYIALPFSQAKLQPIIDVSGRFHQFYQQGFVSKNEIANPSYNTAARYNAEWGWVKANSQIVFDTDPLRLSERAMANTVLYRGEKLTYDRVLKKFVCTDRGVSHWKGLTGPGARGIRDGNLTSVNTMAYQMTASA